MQRILWPLLCLFAFTCPALAQQVQPTAIDLRLPNGDFSFTTAEQSTPVLRAYIRENGSAYTTITSLGGIFFFASNKTDSVGMAVTNTASGTDYLEWTLTRDQTVVPGTYFAQIIVTNSSGLVQEWVRGEFVIEDSPGTTAVNGWAWNSSNYATVAWVQAQIASVQASITGMVSRTEFLATNVLVNGRIDVINTDKVSVATFNASNATAAAGIAGNAAATAVLQTGKVAVTDWQASNAVLQAGIEDAQGMATMGGDVSGPSTNATVIKIQNVSVPDLGIGAGKDGYGLIYDHASGTLKLGQVAAESGTVISNLVLIHDTNIPSSVGVTNVGIYRTMRPGNLPSLVLNAGGAEVGYFDLLGITLKSGGIHLLTDFIEANPAALDGSVTAPAYTWDEDRDLGKYRISYGGDYGEGYAVNSNLVWFWAKDGIHFTNGAALFGIDYVAAWAAGAGLTNAGTSRYPTGALSTASIASLGLADSATQPGDDWTNTVAGMSAKDVTNGAAGGAKYMSESNTYATTNWVTGKGYISGYSETDPVWNGGKDGGGTPSIDKDLHLLYDLDVNKVMHWYSRILYDLGGTNAALNWQTHTLHGKPWQASSPGTAGQEIVTFQFVTNYARWTSSGLISINGKTALDNGVFGSNYLYYSNSTNYVAIWADVSAYYLQAVSNGTPSAIKTNALW